MSRSLRKISLIIKISTTPHRERRSDTPKISSSLLEGFQKEHHAATRAISCTATRAIRHAQSYKGLRAHVLDFCQIWRSLDMSKTIVFNHTEVSGTLLRRSTSYSAATTNEPEASQARHLPHGITSMPQIKNNDSFTKRYFRPFQNAVQVHPMPRLPQKRLPKPLLILTHACPRLSNVQEAPRLPRGCESPMSCTCLGKCRARLQNDPKASHLPRKIDLEQNRARRADKSRPSEESPPRKPFCGMLPRKRKTEELSCC